jgi:hypothetical protein
MLCRKSVLPFLSLLILALFLLPSCKGSNPVAPSDNNDQSSSGNLLSAGLGITQVDNSTYDYLRPGDDLPPYAPDEVLVTLKSAVDIEEGSGFSIQPNSISILDQHGISLKETIDCGWADVYVLKITDGASVPDKIAELLALPIVDMAEPNIRFDFCDVPYTPNDPLWENPNDSDNDPRSTAFEQFGPSKVGANVVWNDVSVDSSVVVCVLDSGVAYDHEDLANVMWVNDDEIPDNSIDDDSNGYIDDIYGWDMLDNDNNIKETNGDFYYHGTSCAGVVAAEMDNGVGCAGIAPNCRIMGIRIGFGYSFLTVVLNGVIYARHNGADIISMSFSSTESSPILSNSMKYAWQDGLVLVAAAANDDNTALHYPAAYDSVVCVGGTTTFGPAWNWQPIDEVRISGAGGYGWGSNYGPQLEVMGFGEFYITLKGDNPHSYYTGSNNDFFRGTSNATPMVAGAFALLKSMYPDADNQWLRDRIKDTADDLDVPGFDIQTGFGRVNLIRACYGADRYAVSEDENGFVDVAVDDNQMIDSIHAVSGNYADTEDLYKITATQDGSLNFFLDIWTWGESVDLFLYSDPSLAPQFLLDQSVGKNHATNSFEVVGCACTEGNTYYVMIRPTDYGDSTTYTLNAEYVQPYLDLETGTFDIGFVHLGGDNKLLGRLDFSSSLVTRISEIMFNIKGTMPGSKLTKLSLFKDTYKNGNFDGLDKWIADAQLNGTNRVIFKNLYEEISGPTSPTRYFLRANFSGITEDAEFSLEMSNYKFVSTVDGIEIAYNKFPYSIGPFYVGVDIEPPVWDDTVGIQATVPRFDGAGIFWNSATDPRTPPVDFNIYYSPEFPFQESTTQVEEDVNFWDAGDTYDHGYVLHGLENNEPFYLMVRAIDQAGNEDDNSYCLSVVPDDISVPTWPQVIGSLNTEGEAREIKSDPANNRIFLADKGGGLLVIDVSDPTEPTLTDTVVASEAYGVDFDGTYVYCAYASGLMVVDPDGADGPEVVANVPFSNALDLCLNGNWAYLTNTGTSLLPVDITDPLNPVAHAAVGSGNYGFTLQAHNGYLYDATWDCAQVFDIANPAAPVFVRNFGVSTCHDLLAIGNTLYCAFWNDRKVVVYDISDPATDVPYMGQWVSDSGWNGSGIVMYKGYLYFGTEYWGIEVLDVTDPANIVQVGEMATNGPDGMATDGIYIYSAEREDGLKIII